MYKSYDYYWKKNTSRARKIRARLGLLNLFLNRVSNAAAADVNVERENETKKSVLVHSW